MAEWSYDFLNWTSFPSSIKCDTQDDTTRHYYRSKGMGFIPVTPRRKVTIRVNVKLKDVMPSKVHAYPGVGAFIGVHGWNEAEKKWVYETLAGFRILDCGTGTRDWTTYEMEGVPKENITAIRVFLAHSYNLPGGGAWFDDLKIFQDGELIFSEDFSNWNPYIGALVAGAISGATGYAITKKPLYSLTAIPGAAIGVLIGYLTSKP